MSKLPPKKVVLFPTPVLLITTTFVRPCLKFSRQTNITLCAVLFYTISFTIQPVCAPYVGQIPTPFLRQFLYRQLIKLKPISVSASFTALFQPMPLVTFLLTGLIQKITVQV